MAEDKVNTGPEAQVPGEGETTVTPPESAVGDPPAQEDGEVVVNTDTIERLMAERRAAARAEVEQGDAASDLHGSEEKPEAADALLPGDGDGAAPAQEETELPDGDNPSLKVGGTGAKVIDFAAIDGEDHREPWEKTQDELDAEQGKKPRRGRPPKDKDGPQAEKTGKPRKGRQPKADKTAQKQGKGERDKVSQGKDGKGPEDPAAGGGPGSAPAAEAEAATPPRPVENQKIVYLKHSELHAFHTFRPHPFKVQNDAKMQEMVKSIQANGVMVPGLARPEKDGNGYEIIAGHRRSYASELAGLEEAPFIVREMTDHEAVQAMKDSNKQRADMLPSEMAALLELEVEDIKHQGTRLKGVAEGDIGKRSVEIVGEAHDLNYKKVMRYLRLNSLVPELLEKVDGALDENGKRKKGIGFMPAVELSYIRPKNQRLIAVSMDGEQTSPSVAQAKRLRELDEKNLLNGDVIDQILCEEKKEVGQVIISTSELNKYFGEDKTPRQMKDQILALLDEWKEKQPPEKPTPEQTAER